MSIRTSPPALRATPLKSAAMKELLSALASGAPQRDMDGGTAKRERDLIRASGLLRLSIPVELGGFGADWIEILDVVRKMATVDSSLAHLFAFHHLMIATVQFFGTAEQARKYMAQGAEANWFWGNALNPKDTRLQLRASGDAFQLNGEKSFCSGATDSDMLIVSAHNEAAELRIAAIPTSRDGVVIRDDWDNMGQRQTDSGTVSFRNVRVLADELLLSPGPLGSPFATLRPCLAQLVLVNIYAGLARGALEEALAYTRALPREAAARVAADPFVLRNVGELWAQAEAAEAIVERAVRAFDRAWNKGDGVTPQERGALAIEIAIAKAASARAALDIGARIFDIMGARATATRFRLDRFWRNARTHTLHDPLDQKLKEIGDWALNGVDPTPSFYS